jgi:repressor LexA
MSFTPLNHRQKEVFVFIRNYIRKEHCGPTFAEIGVAVGLRSSASVNKHVMALYELGWIDYKRNHTRSISIPQMAPKCPHCGGSLDELADRRRKAVRKKQLLPKSGPRCGGKL